MFLVSSRSFFCSWPVTISCSFSEQYPAQPSIFASFCLYSIAVVKLQVLLPHSKIGITAALSRLTKSHCQCWANNNFCQLFLLHTGNLPSMEHTWETLVILSNPGTCTVLSPYLTADPNLWAQLLHFLSLRPRGKGDLEHLSSNLYAGVCPHLIYIIQ